MGKRQGDLIPPEDQITEIDDAAAHYVKIRDKRMKLTEDEIESNDALVAVMKAHKRTSYNFRDGDESLIVTIDKQTKEKAKVKRMGGEKDADE